LAIKVLRARQGLTTATTPELARAAVHRRGPRARDIYALAASGLVITYVSTGILNFAFGAMAYVVARTYYWMHIEKAWGGTNIRGILVSAALSLFVVAPLLGLVLYLAIFQFLRQSSQLIKVVVTIGLSVTLPTISIMLFGSRRSSRLGPHPPSIPTRSSVSP
jgi:branched-subunit amino acid ABC-type transport system permease component